MTDMLFRALQQAASNFIATARVLSSRAIITAAIIVVGWGIAALCRWLTRHALARLGFDRFCERQGLADTLRGAQLPAAGVLASTAIFWIVWVGFLLSGVDVLGFAPLHGLVESFARFVPRLLTGIVILVVGFVLANVAWRATLLAAVNAKVPSPRILSGAVRSLVLLLTTAMALDQVAVASTIVLTAFAITFGAVMLGLAIAFGVGAGDMARQVLERWFTEQPRDAPRDMEHL